MLNIGEVSWDALTGYRLPGHKGTVDLLMYKRDMLNHLIDTFAPKHPFEASCVAKLREIFRDHASYRTKVEPSMAAKKADGFVHPDISYRAKWKKSGRLLAALIEETVFTRDHDGCMKVAIKARKVPEETLEYERFKDRTSEILDALSEEKKQALEDQSAEEQSNAVKAAAVDASATAQSSKDGSNVQAPVDTEANTWQKVAERSFIAHCFLIPEPASETALVTAIQATPLAALKGTPGTQYILVHFDQKLTGGPTSKPSLRYSPMVEDRYTKLMKSAIKARSGDENLLQDFAVI